MDEVAPVDFYIATPNGLVFLQSRILHPSVMGFLQDIASSACLVIDIGTIAPPDIQDGEFVVHHLLQ
jgi:hypothetical protein